MKKIRYAVVGLGHIAQTAVLPAFKHAKKNSDLVALVTGDLKKAKEVSRQYHVENVFNYEELNQLFSSGLVDALYIALPNHLHKDVAIEAMKAGLHVLCEKPLTRELEDAVKLFETARREKVLLMTAYRLHFEQANLRVIDGCRSGLLGELKYFSSDFSFQVKDRQNIRLQKNGGGPLWDIGIYCINACRNIFRNEPYEVFGSSVPGTDSRFVDVPEGVTALLKFPNGKTATFTCSFGADTASRFHIYGSKGSFTLENAYDYATARTLLYTQDESTKKFSYKKSDQFGPELVYFSDCILKDKEPEPSAIEGLADIRIITAIEKSIQKNKPVRLNEDPVIQSKPRPHKGMQKRFPGIHEPKQINVRSPSE